MRKSLIVFVGCALFACSGGDDKTIVSTDVQMHTLIFMDKSVSVNVNRAFVNQKYQQAINDIVEQTIRQKGDKIEVYFIHENTAKARALTLTSRAEMEDISRASATDREAAKTSFDLALQREKGLFKQQLRAKLAESNTNKSNQETDIWASIQVISRLTEMATVVKVYYLSDMVESMKGSDRRDFGRTPPSSVAQADDWAKSDAEQLKKYPIANVDIMLIL
ncbi:MAG: hypothetical protein H7Z72_17420, partial [Bacteroidetes bacterium]|nr:hypothetical protein [Fibrella sp.]